MEQKRSVRGMDYFNLALIAFAGLGLELVLIGIEPFIYGQSVDMKTWTVIPHWILTCMCWSLVISWILKESKKYGFQLREGKQKIVLWKWSVVILLLLLSAWMSYQSWEGVKIYKEWMSKGPVKFIFQYVYYFVETGLFTLIIVFSQKAFEKWFKKECIPYGGIICGLTWGLAHVFTKGSIEVGLMGAILGFGFGAVYLLLNRDIIKAFPIIFLMFIL